MTPVELRVPLLLWIERHQVRGCAPRQRYVPQARAVLQAMRVPSPEMIMAGKHEAGRHCRSFHGIRVAFVAMIDAALADAPQGGSPVLLIVSPAHGADVPELSVRGGAIRSEWAPPTCLLEKWDTEQLAVA